MNNSDRLAGMIRGVCFRDGEAVASRFSTLLRVGGSRCSRAAAATVIVAFLFGAFAPILFFTSTASAKSNRCHTDNFATGAATLSEWAEIGKIWRALHGPGADGGDGPLGCPRGEPKKFEGSSYTWRGVGQEFQRGWILIGRDGQANTEIAIINGLTGWTIWSKGLPSKLLPTVGGVWTTDIRPAASAPTWLRGGEVFVTPPSKYVSLLQCSGNQRYSEPLYLPCTQLTPPLTASNRAFDVAARLDENLLSEPDAAATSLDLRRDAFFPDWIPCYVRPPLPTDVGETAFAVAMMMLRRDTVCPLTGAVPSIAARKWLQALVFPSGMLPGSSWGAESPCSLRVGELDVTLAQLLNLTLNNEVALSGPVLNHIKLILGPWGGAPRNSPYVEPDGTCAGFHLIETENHMLLQETARYLINGLLGKDNAANRVWLFKFIPQLVRRDMYEFNAIPYSRYQLKALFALNDHAPDESVRLLAKGTIHWLFSKQAVSGNLDRDHRPFRRSTDDIHRIASDWWGEAATPVTTATALLAGPVQHAHSDIDLQLNKGLDDAKVRALADVNLYPELAAAPPYSMEALVDVTNTGYRLPPALVGWLQRRFTDESANRNTYLQAINHVPKIGGDSSIFAQPNNGAELVSGNRNWTIIAGGTPAPPGDPGPPPESGALTAGTTIAGAAVGAAVGAGIGAAIGGAPGAAVGAIVGGFVGAIAGNRTPKEIAESTQHDKLWETQAGTVRETTLIPTPVGLDRNHTIRFGRTVLTTESPQISRLCVAEGFMCGYDLVMPVRPFPAQDAANCIVKETFPAALSTHFARWIGPSKTISSVLGCPVQPHGYLPSSRWKIWTFERGMLALGEDAPGKERFAGAWIEDLTDTKAGTLRVAWNNAGAGYDWFRVHAYQREVFARSGEPPGGWVEPLPVVDGGYANEAMFDLDQFPDRHPKWDILVTSCRTDYFLGIETGHTCADDIFPRLTVFVGKLPNHSFSCAAHGAWPSMGVRIPASEGIVMEVGSCFNGPYGLFAYVWQKPCPRTRLDVLGIQCPEGASNYGFVVVTPSRGVTEKEFRATVDLSMARFKGSGQDYVPGVTASIDVPIGPPVTRVGEQWKSTGAPISSHSVTFRWPLVGGASILGDTGAPGLFDPAALGATPDKWPSALGHISAHDGPGSSPLIHSSGTGCFTVAGFPTASDLDPLGLLVDFRKPANPVIDDHIPTSRLAGVCP